MTCFLQGENECDDQTTADQATQAKMKNAFISQNVSSLQELGELCLWAQTFQRIYHMIKFKYLLLFSALSKLKSL